MSECLLAAALSACADSAVWRRASVSVRCPLLTILAEYFSRDSFTVPKHCRIHLRFTLALPHPYTRHVAPLPPQLPTPVSHSLKFKFETVILLLADFPSLPASGYFVFSRTILHPPPRPPGLCPFSSSCADDHIPRTSLLLPAPAAAAAVACLACQRYFASPSTGERHVCVSAPPADRFCR